MYVYMGLCVYSFLYMVFVYTYVYVCVYTDVCLGKKGISDIKTHRFFNGIDWDRLGQKLDPSPFGPCKHTHKPHADYTTFATMMQECGKQLELSTHTPVSKKSELCVCVCKVICIHIYMARMAYTCELVPTYISTCAYHILPPYYPARHSLRTISIQTHSHHSFFLSFADHRYTWC